MSVIRVYCDKMAEHKISLIFTKSSPVTHLCIILHGKFDDEMKRDHLDRGMKRGWGCFDFAVRDRVVLTISTILSQFCYLH